MRSAAPRATLPPRHHCLPQMWGAIEWAYSMSSPSGAGCAEMGVVVTHTTADGGTAPGATSVRDWPRSCVGDRDWSARPRCAKLRAGCASRLRATFSRPCRRGFGSGWMASLRPKEEKLSRASVCGAMRRGEVRAAAAWRDRWRSADCAPPAHSSPARCRGAGRSERIVA